MCLTYKHHPMYNIEHVGRVYDHFESKGIFDLDKLSIPNLVMKLEAGILTIQIC